jgi:hypothetical protein
MGKISRIDALGALDDDNGSWNILWNRVAMVASGVTDADHGALTDGWHLLSMTYLAYFSEFESE